MSEIPPPGVAADPALPGRGALTPERVEAALADFRSWLHEAAASPAPAEDGAAAESPDLHTLLAQFVALRHEVNLQTRSARAQQEHNAEALQQLAEALDELRAARDSAGPQRAHQDQDESVRPLLKTLIDLYDSLALAGREVQRVERSLLPSLAEVAAPPPAAPPPLDVDHLPLPFWARLLGARQAVRTALQASQESAAVGARAAGPEQERAVQAAARIRQLLTSVVTGYTMSVQRVERALQQYGLEPIPCVGQPFDPEVMEAVEVVNDPARAATEVIEEVRRGYLWRGRVFRYAQVRVARPGGPAL